MTIRERDGALAFTSAESWAARKALLARQQGFFTESGERSSINGVGAAIPTGVPIFSALPLLKGDPVTNLIVELATAGSALTLCRLGLYRIAPGGATGTLIPSTSTGDATAALTGATGPQVIPISTGTIVWTDDEVVYAGFVPIGTTGPALMRGVTNPTWKVNPNAQVAPCCKSNAGGATDLRASETFTYGSGAAMGFWVAAS